MIGGEHSDRNFCTETLKTAFLIACVAGETKPEKKGLKYLPALLPPEFFMFAFVSVKRLVQFQLFEKLTRAK